MKLIRRAGLAAALLLIAAPPGLSLLIFRSHTYTPPPAGAFERSPFPFASAPFAVTADDGVVIRGFAAAGKGDTVILALHGFGRDLNQMADRWRGLYPGDASFAVMDFRNHGASGPASTTFGYGEARDVAAVAAHLKKSHGRVVAWGLSMGAAAAARAARNGAPLDALILEGMYDTLSNAIALRGEKMGIPRWPLIPMTLWWYERLSGVRLDEMDMAQTLRGLDAPVMLVHSLGDEKVPKEAFETLRAALGPRGEAFLLAEGLHDAIYETNRGVYVEALRGFLARAAPRQG